MVFSYEGIEYQQISLFGAGKRGRPGTSLYGYQKVVMYNILDLLKEDQGILYVKY